MQTVQLNIRESAYAAALSQALEASGCQVRSVEVPDPAEPGVLVTDCRGLCNLPQPLPNPERVVVVTRNDPRCLSQAWNAGIRAVVFSDEPLATAVLAILAAGLRIAAARPEAGSRDALQAAAGPGPRGTGGLR